MPKNISILLLTFMIAMMTSCSNEKHEKLIGEWQGFSWIIEGKESNNNAAEVTFSFNAENRYKGSWGNKTERGVYRMDRNKLYTTEEGKLEKMVKIEFLGSDTLVFHMNRMGTEEHLFLARSKK
jgi:competence protein ComGF